MEKEISKDDCLPIRLAGIVRESIVDGPGIRFTIFCQGCPHNCLDCHNPKTHDFNGGYLCSQEKILDAIDKNPLLKGVTFSGGEPMCQPEAFYQLAVKIKERGLDIVTFTGYTYEELIEMGQDNLYIIKLLEQTDYLIDGPFIKSEKDLSLSFRGSKNQRYIDMRRTRNEKRLVLVEN